MNKVFLLFIFVLFAVGCTTTKIHSTQVVDTPRKGKETIVPTVADFTVTDSLDSEGKFQLKVEQVQRGSKMWMEARPVVAIVNTYCPHLYWSQADCSFNWSSFALWHVVGVGFIADAVLPFIEPQKAETINREPTGKYEKTKQSEDITIKSEPHTAAFIDLKYEFVLLPEAKYTPEERISKAVVSPSVEGSPYSKSGVIQSLSAENGNYTWNLIGLLERAAADGEHIRVSAEIGTTKFEKILFNDERIEQIKNQKVGQN